MSYQNPIDLTNDDNVNPSLSASPRWDPFTALGLSPAIYTKEKINEMFQQASKHRDEEAVGRYPHTREHFPSQQQLEVSKDYLLRCGPEAANRYQGELMWSPQKPVGSEDVWLLEKTPLRADDVVASLRPAPLASDTTTPSSARRRQPPLGDVSEEMRMLSVMESTNSRSRSASRRVSYPYVDPTLPIQPFEVAVGT